MRLARLPATLFVSLLACGGSILGDGCTPDSEILCGRWQTRPPEMQSEPGEQPLFPGGLELLLGHYGPDVVGIVRFYERAFTESDDCGINDPPAAGCGCSYLANGNWNEDRRKLSFRLDATTVDELFPSCLPDAVEPPPPNATTRLEFELRLQGDNTLVGQARWVGSTAPHETLEFTRLSCENCKATHGASCQ